MGARIGVGRATNVMGHEERNARVADVHELEVCKRVGFGTS